jgi:hypothetical protein
LRWFIVDFFLAWVFGYGAGKGFGRATRHRSSSGRRGWSGGRTTMPSATRRCQSGSIWVRLAGGRETTCRLMTPSISGDGGKKMRGFDFAYAVLRFGSGAAAVLIVLSIPR